MKTKNTTALLGALSLLAASQVGAVGVSVAFNSTVNDGDNPPKMFTSSDLAGVAPMLNWNNADAVTNGSYSGFVDNTGAANTLSITSIGGASNTWNTSFADIDQLINADWANNLTQMTLADIT